MHELRRWCKDLFWGWKKKTYQPNIAAIWLKPKNGAYANNVFVVSPLAWWAFSPQTDRIVISSRAPSSPSPRAHKSSRSCRDLSAAARGPGWHSVFHYILVSLAERHSPTAFPYISWSSSWCIPFAHKKKTTIMRKDTRCWFCGTGCTSRALFGFFLEDDI